MRTTFLLVTVMGTVTWRFRPWWQETFITDLREPQLGGWGPAAGSCGHGNEASGSKLRPPCTEFIMAREVSATVLAKIFDSELPVGHFTDTIIAL
jgi:hypothetical protein